MKLSKSKLRNIVSEEIQKIVREGKADQPTLSFNDLETQFSDYFSRDVKIYDGSRFIYIDEDTRGGVGFNNKSLTKLMRLPGFSNMWVKSSDDTIEYMFYKDKAMK